MTAQEQQDERVVGGRRRGGRGPGQCPLGDGALAAPAGLLRAQQVGQPPGGDRDQPAARGGRDAVARPLRGGGQQRLLHGVLGGVEVPVPSADRAEGPRGAGGGEGGGGGGG